ncbi:hypothetical protein QTP70_025483, partial [Hemibagrus guttatus]
MGKCKDPRCTMGRRQAGGSSVMLWATFYRKILGPVVHVDVTLTQCSYLKISAHQVHPFMAAMFPNARVLFQQDEAYYCNTAYIVQERFQGHEFK